MKDFSSSECDLVEIHSFEKKYKNIKFNKDFFEEKFSKNGSQRNEYCFYFYDYSPEYFIDSWADCDPRLYDFPPEEFGDDFYENMNFPVFSVFVTIEEVNGDEVFVKDFRLCKVYPSGNMTAGRHSSVLTDEEASQIDFFFDDMLVG